LIYRQVWNIGNTVVYKQVWFIWENRFKAYITNWIWQAGELYVRERFI